MKSLLAFILLLLAMPGIGQKKKLYIPAWTFQQDSTIIYGMSVGLWNFTEHTKSTTTNGLRFSLIGEGIAVGFIPESPIPDSDTSFQRLKKEPYTEQVNGISISGTGIAGEYEINGISLGLVGHLTKRVNGLSASALNFSMQHNGIQFAIFLNECYSMNGLQIGAVNKSKRTRGIQVGLWNVNERRKLPIINWNF